MEDVLDALTRQPLPDREALELKIQAVQEAIVRLLETPYTKSLEQKRERLAQLYREYAEAYGVG